MYLKSVIYICVFNFVLFERKTDAISSEQMSIIQQHFQVLEMSCLKEYPITAEDCDKLKAKEMASGPNVPCFLSCIFKEIGIINKDGMLEKETVLNLAKKVFTTDEELQLISDYLHSCYHINDNAVTDGDKGCERSTMAFECLTQNAAKFGRAAKSLSKAKSLQACRKELRSN